MIHAQIITEKSSTSTPKQLLSDSLECEAMIPVRNVYNLLSAIKRLSKDELIIDLATMGATICDMAHNDLDCIIDDIRQTEKAGA